MELRQRLPLRGHDAKPTRYPAASSERAAAASGSQVKGRRGAPARAAAPDLSLWRSVSERRACRPRGRSRGWDGLGQRVLRMRNEDRSAADAEAPELCRRPCRSDRGSAHDRRRARGSNGPPAVAIRRHVRLLGEGDQGAGPRGAHRRCADRAIPASPKNVGRPGGASSGLDVSVRRTWSREVGRPGQRAGGRARGGGGEGVDALASEQFPGISAAWANARARRVCRSPRSPRQKRVRERRRTCSRRTRSRDPARRTVEQLVGEAEPGSVATATRRSARNHRSSCHRQIWCPAFR